MTKMQTAAEAARDNLAKAKDYLETMTEARRDAEYREKVARQLYKEAEDALTRATEAEARRG